MAHADEPVPWPGGERAALAWPDAAWGQALAATQQRQLGFTAEQMQNYGRDAFITRPVAIAFRDARAIPRMSGKLSDDLLAAAKDPAELVRLGFTLSDAVSARNFPRPEGAAWGVPWLPDESPGAALAVVLARMSPGLKLDDADEASWARLPEAVQRLVVRALVGLVEGDPWIRLAFDDDFLARSCGVEKPADLTRDALYRLASAPWSDETDDQTATRSRASFEALRRTDRDYLGYGSVIALTHLSVGFAEWRAAAPASGISTTALAGLSFTTPMGEVRILGTGSDRVSADDSLLIVDIGGDDRYLGRQATPDFPRRVESLVIDLAGNDTYDASDVDCAMGCGLFGLGGIVDLSGNDRYACRDSGLGSAWHGTGFVLDEAGDDSYTVHQWSDAAAHVGVGLVVDLSGNDVHSCAQQSQAMGSTLGAGILLDVEGNDRYVARDDGNVSALYLDQSVAMAQGVGFGRRADLGDGHSLAGGFGVLVDGAGNDLYHSQVWSQGAGYWWSVGILEDRGGNDVYENGKYSLGAGAHFAIGCQVDLVGDDRYNVGSTTAMNQYQGHARDGSIGISIDGDGNDQYLFRSHCGGSGDLVSLGLFWDRRGDDTYAVRPADDAPPDGFNGVPPMGSATKYDPMRSFRDDMDAIGIFLDTGGNDTYPQGGEPTQGGTWTRHPHPHSWGFGADLESYAAH